ncbi:MAG TPA: serine hydrolase [Streptosporangiaceae bacterium]|nr:serine hydrolase [Streptosporangiaceae bacterium]
MEKAAIAKVFADVGCQGWLCVREVHGPGAVTLDAEDLVVSASVAKIAVALEVFRQAHLGRLDLRERVRVCAADRTVGPTGFSTFDDDVEVSVRDLARMMMVVSDNAATDVLIDLVGLDAVHVILRSLGLHQTVVPTPFRDMLDSIGQDLGFTGWAELMRVNSSSPRDAARIDKLLPRVRALQPGQTTRTTAAETATLLSLIWRDEAGPPSACAQVRQLMAAQLTRNRLAMGFTRSVKIAAKTGSLAGIIRNEAGVIEYPDGRRYVAAVFTRAHQPGVNEHQINHAIGASAALAIQSLYTR